MSLCVAPASSRSQPVATTLFPPRVQEQQRKMVRVLRKLSREGPRGVVGQLEGLRQENTGLSIRYNAAQVRAQGDGTGKGMRG